jgi:hypothetical protein
MEISNGWMPGGRSQQILRRDLTRHLRPVTAPGKPFKVSTRIPRTPSRQVLGEVCLNQPDSEIFVAKLNWNADPHRISRSRARVFRM